MKAEKKNRSGDENSFFIRISIAVLGVFFLSLVVSRLIYPFGVGSWESFNWMPAEHLWEGKSPYAFAFSPPFGMSPYGIVFYALIGLGVKVFGYQIWFGRIMSVLAFSVCLWAITRIARNLGLNRESVWIVCLAGLAMFPAQIWIAMMRPDLIAAAFAFSAVALAFRFDENKRISSLCVAALVLLACAAFFTKQTYLLPAAIIFLRFLQLKKWREAAIFIVGFAVIVSSGVFLLDFTSGGGYFWQHFRHAERLPFSWQHSAEIFLEMLKQPTFFLALAWLLIFIFHNRRIFSNFKRHEVLKIARTSRGLMFFYLLVSLFWSVISSARVGGNANYYIESSLLLAIVCGLVFEHFKREKIMPSLASAMIILLTLGGAFQISRILRGEYFRWQSLSYYLEVFETVGKIEVKGKKCVSVYPELVVWNGCAFNFDDFEEYVGEWSPELNEIFERELRAGHYAAVIWTDDKFAEKYTNFRLVKMSQNPPEKYFKIFLYVPRETP